MFPYCFEIPRFAVRSYFNTIKPSRQSRSSSEDFQNKENLAKDRRTDGRPAEEVTTELSNERCFKKLYPMKCKVLFLVQLLILV